MKTRSLSHIFLLMTALTSNLECFSQTKFYVSAGLATSLTANTNVLLDDNHKFFSFRHKILDVDAESRLIGSINIVTGLSVFDAGYTTDSRSFGSASDFNATYLGVPLMARWNIGRKNSLFVDFGWQPTYLLKANLKEEITKFGSNYVVEGDITRYSNRFYLSWKLQFVILINRFMIMMYYYSPLKGQSTLRNLEEHWGLNLQQSTYLLSGGHSDFTIFGIKGGVRIR